MKIFLGIIVFSASASESNLINNKKFERSSGFWSNHQDESNKSYFSKLTDPKSQREDWYKLSPYIAEFWCAISNAGFLYVGAKHKSYELLFAGIASFISHSNPKQWLLHVDKIGVLIVLSKLIREYKVVASNPKLVILLVCAAATINAIDAYLARNKAKTWPHVVWHLSSALIADQFLNLAKK